PSRPEHECATEQCPAAPWPSTAARKTPHRCWQRYRPVAANRAKTPDDKPRSRAAGGTSGGLSSWDCNQRGLLADGRKGSAQPSRGRRSNWWDLWESRRVEFATGRGDRPTGEWIWSAAAAKDGAAWIGLENDSIPPDRQTCRCTEAVRFC